MQRSAAGNGDRGAGSCQQAALTKKEWARVNSRYQGQVEAMAIFTRRTLIPTSAPILSSLSRSCRRLPRAHCVCASPIRRNVQSSEPLRVCRSVFGLSYAASATSSAGRRCGSHGRGLEYREGLIIGPLEP
jgi:hypothetical protein